MSDINDKINEIETALGTDKVDEEIIRMEKEAYREKIEKDKEGTAHLIAGMLVGLDKVNELCRVVYEAGMDETLAEYAVSIMTVGFHIGFISGMEARK